MRPSEPHQMCVVSRETLKQALVALRMLKINSVNRAAYVRARIEGAYEEITAVLAADPPPHEARPPDPD
ncbi:MAG TPA: hypothetical protein VFK36_09680 [Gemmatimonadales bacterium]|nr:hypothetical protein [Gemmatimonadales bacterium]